MDRQPLEARMFRLFEKQVRRTSVSLHARPSSSLVQTPDIGLLQHVQDHAAIFGSWSESDMKVMSWGCSSDESAVICQASLPWNWSSVPLHSMPVMPLASVQTGVQLCSTHVISLRPSHV